MAYLFLALLLPELSLQLPHLTLKSSSLQSRAESVYSFDLSRVTPRVAVVDDVSASDSSDPGLIRDVERRSKYLFPITVEGEVFQMEMDTGSSDTWIIRTGFSCYEYYDRSSDIFSEPQPQKVCNFGPTYTPGPGFKINPSIIEKQGYRGGTRYVRGPMGHVSLSIGGVTVQQLIGVPNKTSFHGYGEHEQSGMLGMAQKGLTRAYNATNGRSVPYSPIMQTIFDTVQLPAKQFSLALSRDDSNNGNGGVFTIGGLPENTPSVNISNKTPTSAEMRLFTKYSDDELTFYSILVDDFFVGDNKHARGLQILIDSGANTFEVPEATAKTMNSLWSPPSPVGDARVSIACNALLTKNIGITIGGRKYNVSSQDLIRKRKDETCSSLITSSTEEDGYVIGDPFLKNVLAVFDWKDSTMEFYPRQYYQS